MGLRMVAVTLRRERAGAWSSRQTSRGHMYVCMHMRMCMCMCKPINVLLEMASTPREAPEKPAGRDLGVAVDT